MFVSGIVNREKNIIFAKGNTSLVGGSNRILPSTWLENGFIEPTIKNWQIKLNFLCEFVIYA